MYKNFFFANYLAKTLFQLKKMNFIKFMLNMVTTHFITKTNKVVFFCESHAQRQ